MHDITFEEACEMDNILQIMSGLHHATNVTHNIRLAHSPLLTVASLRVDSSLFYLENSFCQNNSMLYSPNNCH